MNKNHRLITTQSNNEKRNDFADQFGRNILLICMIFTILCALIWFFDFSGESYRFTEYVDGAVCSVMRQIGFEMAQTVEETAEGTEDTGIVSDGSEDMEMVLDDAEETTMEETPEDMQEDVGDTEKVSDDCKEAPERITPYVPYTSYTPEPTNSRYYSDIGLIPDTMVAEYKTVDDDYFDDSCWIGDSRCMGIFDYSSFTGADFFCDNGYCAYSNKLGKAVKHQRTNEKVTLENAMNNKKYGKVYLMLGINDCGYGNTQTFKEDYKAMIDTIREAQPDAIIYLVGNLHVARGVEEANPIFSNKNINAKNVAISKCADGVKTIYLDLNSLYVDEEGYLRKELTFDGFHLYASGYTDAITFFKQHAFVE